MEPLEEALRNEVDEVAESIAYHDLVIDLLQQARCPVITDNSDAWPWWEYCGDPLIPGTDTCVEHQPIDGPVPA